MYIYALELEQGKYYVGKSNQPEVRIEQHESAGSCWTKLYKPISVLYIKESTSIFDEDVCTKELMLKYGIDHVRGGSYVLPQLTPHQIEFIGHELKSATDVCLKCGKPGHFMDSCPAIVKIKGTRKGPLKGPQKCTRCKRYGHTKKTCYATTKLDGSAFRKRKI